MTVDAARTYDSVGGGCLEFEATALARKLLAEGRAAVQAREFAIGKDLPSAAVGASPVLLECFPARAFHIAPFGTGHVGRALSTILAELPCRVRWFDSRAGVFPPAVAANIGTVTMQNPFAAVENCPPAATPAVPPPVKPAVR